MSSPDDTSSFVDQEGLSDDDFVYRRIVFPGWVDFTQSDIQGRPRIKRAAFQDFKAEKARALGYPGPCLSVGLHSSLIARERQPVDLLEGWESEDRHYGIARLRVGDVHQIQRGVMAWPTQEEPWHAVVFSKVSETKAQRAAAESALAQAATWIHVPEPPIGGTA